MSSPSDVEPSGDRGRFRGLRRPQVVWVGVAAAVVIVAVVVALQQAGEPGNASPTTPSPTSTASVGAGEPAASPSITPGEASPSLAPTEPGPTASDDGTVGAEPGARPTAVPVPIDEAAEPQPQVSVRLAQIEAVEGEANIPGEVGGPSLRVTVSVSNASAAEVDLTSAVVNLSFGADRVPAIDLREPGRRDLPQTVAPGGEAAGVFVFLVPVESRDDVVVEFDLSVDATVLLFTGSVP